MCFFLIFVQKGHLKGGQIYILENNSVPFFPVLDTNIALTSNAPLSGGTRNQLSTAIGLLDVQLIRRRSSRYFEGAAARAGWLDGDSQRVFQ